MFLKCGAKNAGYTRVGARKKIKKARKNFPTGMRAIKKELRCLKNKIKKRKRKKTILKNKKKIVCVVCKNYSFYSYYQTPTLHITLLLV